MTGRPQGPISNEGRARSDPLNFTTGSRVHVSAGNGPEAPPTSQVPQGDPGGALGDTTPARPALESRAAAPLPPRLRAPEGWGRRDLHRSAAGFWRGQARGGECPGPVTWAPARPLRSRLVATGRGAPVEAWSPGPSSGLRSARPLGPPRGEEEEAAAAAPLVAPYRFTTPVLILICLTRGSAMVPRAPRE